LKISERGIICIRDKMHNAFHNPLDMIHKYLM